MRVAMASVEPGEPGTAELKVAIGPVAASSVQAVERIYERSYHDVYRYVLALTRSTDDAEEVVADTFERALKAWRELPQAPLPWLLLTARRLATDRWRRARMRGLMIVQPRRFRFEDKSDFWLWFDSISRVLSPRQREVLVLRYQADLTDADIAAIMSLSESGVRSLVARALSGLRNHPELLR